MNLSLGQGAILTYLAAVLLLGGAGAAGFGANGLLEIAGAGLMAWIWWKRPGTAATRTGLRLFLAALALIAAIQFLPLPPALWTLIPGRAAIASGFELARMPLPWLTLSLDPWSTLQSLVWWIPALALFMAMRSSDAPSTRHAVWVIAAVAYASVLVAGLQVYQNTGYVYTVTNRGNGVGAFSNSNHFGTFMLMAIALIAAQWLHDSRDNGADKKALARPLQLSALLAPLVIGVFLSNSLACILLLIPMICGVYLLARPELTLRWPWLLAGGLLFSVGLVWLLASGLVANDLMNTSATAGISRGEFLRNGLRILADFAPFGSGLGTFRELYPWYEDHAKVGTTYANHAHNDLLELLIETGVFGLVLVLLFARWFASTAWSLWRGFRREHRVALGSTLAIAAVMAHSLIDYPLRTAAISSLIALCCVVARRPAEVPGAKPHRAAETGAGKREEMLQI